MVGSKVTSVRRRAKVLLIDLDSNYTLMTHLKMTGQLVYVAQKQIEDRSLETEEVAKNAVLDPHYPILSLLKSKIFDGGLVIRMIL
jgi:formamidopyrimidine-DNA glycosylase